MSKDDDFESDKDYSLERLMKLLRDSSVEYKKDRVGEKNVKSQQPLLDEYGIPDNTRTYKEGKLEIVVREWYSPAGGFKTVEVIGEDSAISEEDVKKRVSEIINEIKETEIIPQMLMFDPNNEIGLNKRLEEAILKEEYMLAATLRDEIKVTRTIIEEKIGELNKNLIIDNLNLSEILLEEIKVLKSYIND